MTDRQLLQQALDAMCDIIPANANRSEINRVQHSAIAALRERLAHCDRCGKRLGGEGHIHTCTPHEQKRFEQWWDAGDDIPNNGSWTHDTPIQFAWAGWQAALAQPKQEGDIHTCSPDPIGDAQDRLIAEMAAQPEKEPYGYVSIEDHPVFQKETPEIGRWKTVYPTPPAAQRQWVGLTDQERNKLWRDVIKWGDPSHDDVDLMKAIEAKLKEKNT